MSKILLIISAVLLLGSSALSFMNKSKMALKTQTIKDVTGEKNAAQADAAKAKITLKDTTKKLDEATSAANDLKNQLTAKTNEVAQVNDQLTAVKAEIASKQADIDRLNDVVKKVMNGGPNPEKGEGVEGLANQIKEITAQRDELKTVKESLELKLKGTEDSLALARKEIADRLAGAHKPGLRGRVDAIDRNWNFVVINLGDRDGINNGSKMLVTRGGSVVGQLRVSSVEPTQSIGDIVPNSVPPGVSVQAGDTVVFPGQ